MNKVYPDKILVRGAKVHNLKNINVDIPLSGHTTMTLYMFQRQITKMVQLQESVLTLTVLNMQQKQRQLQVSVYFVQVLHLLFLVHL